MGPHRTIKTTQRYYQEYFQIRATLITTLALYDSPSVELEEPPRLKIVLLTISITYLCLVFTPHEIIMQGKK